MNLETDWYLDNLNSLFAWSFFHKLSCNDFLHQLKTNNNKLITPSAYYTCWVLSGCANSFVVTQHHNCVTRSCARDMLEKKTPAHKKKLKEINQQRPYLLLLSSCANLANTIAAQLSYRFETLNCWIRKPSAAVYRWPSPLMRVLELFCCFGCCCYSCCFPPKSSESLLFSVGFGSF